MTRAPFVRLTTWPLLVILLPACGIRGDGTLTPTVAPGVPTAVGARAGNGSVTVDWSETAQGAHYTVMRSLLPQGPFFPVSVPSGFQGPTRYVDTNLTNGTTYYYHVVAANGFGESVPSPTVSGTPGFKAIAASCSVSSSDNLVVLRDGSVWEWGATPTFLEVDQPLRVSGLPDVTAVSSGNSHDLALASDGTVWAWGSDQYGQLGIAGGSRDPVRVENLTDAVAVAAGGGFSLALTHDGSVWAWGTNANGELGTGSASPASTSVPQPVPGLSDIIAISAGMSHGVALRSDGLVFVWGDNASGQLGNGGTSPGPVGVAQVQGLTGIIAVSAGSGYTLTLRSDGTVWGWGDNGYGQIGVGTAAFTGVTPSTVTVPTPAPGVSGAVGVAASAYVSLAVREDGTVWTWGFNYFGALGYGTAGDYMPVPTPARAPSLSNIVFVTASVTNCLALGAEGTVFTWGNNTQGELGNGMGTKVSTPLEMSNVSGATAIAAGNSFSLFALAPGTVYGVGETDLGQLGDGGGVTMATSDPFLVSGPAGVTALAAGDGHGLALTGTGEVWGWGLNDHGQVGNGTVNNPTTPVKALAPSGILALSAGKFHSLAIRREPGTNEQTAWAWGWNDYGMCGQGTSTASVPSPSPVAGLSGVVSVAGGFYHSLAALSDGTVWGWGANTSGQLGQPELDLGDPSQPWTTVPLQVPGITGAVAVAAGTYTSYALLSDGTVLAWGMGQDGELGHGGDPVAGTAPSGPTPLQVLDLTGVTAIAAGDQHAIALKNDGTIWSWGYNVQGQLGNPVHIVSSVPVRVQGIASAVRISSGLTHCMALLSNGTIRLWGQNQWYELGVPSMDTSVTPVIVTR